MVFGFNKEVSHQCVCLLWHLAEVDKLTSVTSLGTLEVPQWKQGNVLEKTTHQVTDIQNNKLVHSLLMWQTWISKVVYEKH